MNNRIADIVYQITEPITQEMNLELVDVEYVKEAGQFILRVFIDKSEGITLDDCQNLSTRLSNLLDENDPIPGSYTLEVSSPGIDRPLKKDADFKRFAGHNVDVSTYSPVYKNKKKFTAELIGLVDDKIAFLIDGEQVEIPRDQISKVRLAVEF